MPYYVFRVSEPRRFEHLETFEKYPAARAWIRTQRTEEGSAPEQFRMMFAQTPEEAERLLATPRSEYKVVGED